MDSFVVAATWKDLKKKHQTSTKTKACSGNLAAWSVCRSWWKMACPIICFLVFLHFPDTYTYIIMYIHNHTYIIYYHTYIPSTSYIHTSYTYIILYSYMCWDHFFIYRSQQESWERNNTRPSESWCSQTMIIHCSIHFPFIYL